MFTIFWHKVNATPKILGEKEQYFYIETEVVNTYKYIVNQITSRIYWNAYCIVLFFSIQHFGKLGINLNDLGNKVLASESRSLMVKTIGWLQGRLSLSSFWGW